ncbi:MAG: phospholipase [Actinomycetota bacterium]|jgi:phospholipase C|nr:phospholipase [Actinomycetota bacterium]
MKVPGKSGAYGALLLLLAAVRLTEVAAEPPSRAIVNSPIQHIVLIDQENHSFDNVLGKFCSDVAAGTMVRPGADMPCDGATTATLADGKVMALPRARDVVPYVVHNVASQQAAIHGGTMDGFESVGGCGSDAPIPYGCFPQYYPSQIPNVTRLASAFTVSDRTFEFRSTPSWVGHMVLASAEADGFVGNNPVASGKSKVLGPGWGCDSLLDANWSSGAGQPLQLVPACVPDRSGAGPYRTSPVRYVPTIFDRLDTANRTWKIYGGLDDPNQLGSGYGWAICPTFYECLGSKQSDNLVPASSIIGDAQAGTLPSYSIVTPTAKNSQHNSFSMTVGDNWIGDVVEAIEHGPDWSSTAILITWDDCGCFYDHVAPPQRSWGIRVPMIIVSPYAKAGYTDTHPASYISVLALVEHTFGLAPLNNADATAYDYAGSFDRSRALLRPVKMVRTQVPASELRRIAKHLVTLEPT